MMNTVYTVGNRIENVLNNVLRNYNVTKFNFVVTNYVEYTLTGLGILEITVLLNNTANLDNATLKDDITIALENQFEFEYECHVNYATL